MKIDKLTKEQESRFPELVDKWLRIGLRTEPLDHQRIRKVYYDFQSKILKRPIAPVVILDGPTHSWISVCLFRGSGQVSDRVRNQVENQVRNQVWNQVRNQVANQVWNQVANQVEKGIWPYWSGQFWAGWFSFYEFMHEVLGISLCHNYEILRDCCAGVCWPLESLCIISDSPSTISMRNGLLHNEVGPAISYRDETKIYALNGIKMSPEHVETPAEKIEPGLVLAETNADVRRELIRKVGVERMLSKLPHKSLSKSANYELLSIRLSDQVTDARYLKMINPSIGVFHVEGVAPECDTVEKALNWRNNNWHTNAEILT